MSDRHLYVRRPCDECPWRRDQPPGRFPPERFEALRATCEPGGIKPMFACHKTEARERACAGFLLVEGWQSNLVRLHQSRGLIDMARVEAGGLDLYSSYAEMAAANGAGHG